ncbi:MAG TPA: SCP2 sterol-binding domain-containing protein [Thermoleophilaceae bacterium]|jgi:putative sterol carrier protein
MQERLESLGEEQLDPDRFSAIVREASDRELAELLGSEHRERVLDEIFFRMPERLNADRTRGMHAVVHWRIGDRPGGGEDLYEVVIADGSCSVSRGASSEPGVTFKIRPESFLRLIAGATSGMKLVLKRRLSVEGDMALAMRLEGLFERG